MLHSTVTCFRLLYSQVSEKFRIVLKSISNWPFKQLQTFELAVVNKIGCLTARLVERKKCIENRHLSSKLFMSYFEGTSIVPITKEIFLMRG